MTFARILIFAMIVTCLCVENSYIELSGGLKLYTDESTILKMKTIMSDTTVKRTVPYPYTADGETPDHVECKKNLIKQCERGSVKIDPWYRRAIAFQQHIQMNRSIDNMQIPSTHNSHIDYADGHELWQRDLTKFVQQIDPHQLVHLTNQWITVTDQMELGIRGIELDVHFYAGKLRICHAGVKIQWVDDMVNRIARMFNTTIRWDSQTIGCFSSIDPTFDDALDELNVWMSRPQNSREVLIIYLDNKEHLQRWNLVKDLHAQIEKYFAKIIFTPQMKRDRFPNRWPSFNELIAMGKRIVFFNRHEYGAALEPNLFSRNQFLQDGGMHAFRPYPACKPDKQQPNVKVGRIVSYGLWYAWFDRNNEYTNASRLAQVMECDSSNIIALEHITPKLMESIIWSWDKNEPSKLGCVIMDSNTKRWKVASDCNQSYQCACQSKSNENGWVLSGLSEHNKCTCPEGYQFSTPQNGRMNKSLKDIIRNTTIWLNLIQ